MKNIVLFTLISICSIACSSVPVKETLSQINLCSDSKTTLISEKDPVQMIENSRELDYLLNLDARGNKMTAIPKSRHDSDVNRPNQIVVHLRSGKVVYSIEKNCNGKEKTLVI